MATKEMNLIVKILGLVGAIFVLIAQFVPWGRGAFLFGANNGGFDAFYVTFMGQGAWQAILFGVMMIVLFFINLIVLILAFLTFKNFAIKGTKRYLTLGIIATVEFILYIVALNAAFGGLAGFIGYGIGFVMILLAMIMFYVTYGLGRALGIYTTTAMHQQPPVYQQAQPQMMYTSQQQPPVQQTPPPQPPPTQPQPQQQTQQPTQKTAKGKAAATPKFCPQCGAQLQAGIKFCPGCGSQV